MATISDVATKAGVGVGTVSRVLNDNPRVSPDTRKKVLEAVEALDYVPNPFARRLSLGKTLTLAVIVPFFTRPSYVERLRGVEAAIAETEYDLIVYNVESVTKRDEYFKRVPHSARVDGLIIISLPPTNEHVEHFLASEVPTVLVDTRHPDLPRVFIDDVEGGRRATEHLIELGHERIAFLGDAYPNPFGFTSNYDRHVGYIQALDEAGIEARPVYHVTGEHSRDVAQSLAQDLLSLDHPPTAIVAASDTQALGVLEAAREHDISIPEELSVVGYDDIEIAEYFHLTTIRQPLFESGWRGTHLLLSLIESDGVEPVADQLPLELVVRETTAEPAS